MDFLIATTNPGKVKEFREMLGSSRFNWLGLMDVAPQSEVEETGHTFRANAVLKACAYATSTGLCTMADDSGLEVDALVKKPGIFSARWARMHDAGEGDLANNALLLEQLKSVPAPMRTARFVCVLAVADHQGRLLLTTRATLEGRIGFLPVGENGFGYDPLFELPDQGRTSAQLPPADKHRISHRGQALQRMKPLLDRLRACGAVS